MRAPSIEALALASVLVAAPGCGDAFVATGGAGGTSSTSTGGGGSQGGGAGGTTTTTGPACEVLVDDPCNQCLVAECGDAYCACVDSSDCVDLGACLGDAATDAEVIGCWHDHPDSISLVGQLQVCAAPKCEACMLAAPDPCTACEYTECPSQTNACFSNPACLDLGECLIACEGKPDVDACQSNCLTEIPEGVQDIQPFSTCISQHCAEACK